ncbi:MAG: FkbM family methyltransferase [Arenicella sp.]
MKKLSSFTTIDTVYGPFIVNRHCHFHAEVLIKSGYPHIQDEIEKIQAILTTLPDNSVMIDAGANIGLITVPAAQALQAKGGKVIAFEPQRAFAYALGGTCVLNELDNVVVNAVGLGADEHSKMIQLPNYNKPQDFGLFDLNSTHSDQGEKIEVVSIDSLKLPRLDFLKIDVEGMDVEVLKGAAQAIKAYKPWCWVEYWKSDLEAIKTQFQRLNYQFYKMDKLNLLCVPVDRPEAANVNVAATSI